MARKLIFCFSLFALWPLTLSIPLSSCSQQEAEVAAPAPPIDDASDLAPIPNVKSYLKFPGTSKTILTSTTTDPAVFYTEVLASHSWGHCNLFPNGRSELLVTTYFANRTLTIIESLYNSRNCSGIRVASRSLLTQGLVLSIASTPVPGIWFVEIQEGPNTRYSLSLKLLKNGKLDDGGPYRRAEEISEANYKSFNTESLIR